MAFSFDRRDFLKEFSATCSMLCLRAIVRTVSITKWALEPGALSIRRSTSKAAQLRVENAGGAELMGEPS